MNFVKNSVQDFGGFTRSGKEGKTLCDSWKVFYAVRVVIGKESAIVGLGVRLAARGKKLSRVNLLHRYVTHDRA